MSSLSPFTIALPLPDETGFVPPDDPSAACAAGVGKAVGGLVKAVVGCHRKAASAAMKGAAFDEVSCEAAAEPDSLKRRYDLANGDVYCAGTVPFP